MTTKDLKTLFRDQLTSYSKEEADRLFFIFLEEISGISLLQFLSNSQKELEKTTERKMLESLEQLKAGIPYQHILGYTYFSGLKLKVSGAALIPRPETEELAYLIKERVKSKTGLRILDIGTGTGCLALACASNFKNSVVEAWDISDEALILAVANAKAAGLKVQFNRVDFLSAEDLPEHLWDVLVSNPPYIGLQEGKEMEDVVLNNEPHLALFVPDNDPLVFYSAIARYARQSLNNGGQIFVEINQKLGPETLKVFLQEGFRSELLKDLSGNDRFVIAQK